MQVRPAGPAARLAGRGGVQAAHPVCCCSTSTASAARPTAAPSASSALQGQIAALALSASIALSGAPALAAVATPPLASTVQEAFAAVDSDNNGFFSASELAAGMPALGAKDGLPLDEWEYTAQVYDLNMDGQLPRNEFLVAVALDRAVGGSRAAGDRATSDLFHALDVDASGFVSRGEMLAALPGSDEEDVLGALFNRVDGQSDGNGLLDEAEMGDALLRLKGLLLD